MWRQILLQHRIFHYSFFSFAFTLFSPQRILNLRLKHACIPLILRAATVANSSPHPVQAVIRVFFSDGTFKCFLVTESQTANAVKFMVSKKLGLDPKELHLFGIYLLEDGSKGTPMLQNSVL
jgi:hypothetical protein